MSTPTPELPMYPLEEARAILRARGWRLPHEYVALAQAQGRVLAQAVFADMDMPPFPKSAVDGYACKRDEVMQVLRVTGEIAAGKQASEPVASGTCMRIMTGAPMPEGADCVVMQERASFVDEHRVRFSPGAYPANYCPQGEELRAGDLVLPAGVRLKPQHLAMLASAGCAEPCVSRRPRVTVVATGSELVAPAAQPGPGQIRNSNTTQLVALLQALGIDAVSISAVEDEPELQYRVFEAALRESDVLISTGGVSVGAYDLVPAIVARLGLDVLIRRVAIQPGKPMIFAANASQAVFGLSGNPVSSYLQFQLFVEPFLLGLMGAASNRPAFRAPLAETLTRKNVERMQWLPVSLRADGSVARVTFHGSAHVHALCDADGWIAFPVGIAHLPQGQMVEVQRL